ncbi:MAG TPA: bifunctional hydroxymethylpyrimidine kinase/phosphomethylpyrimidine kinase [Gemmatimonadaceae bacterium]|nr:bifunctional hydroxymethylpyrimidine kinase/phosphomethylpyrimidine kinase [Gemmatimonadaceae bacterium]
MRIALTIAGSDSGGGAGIQADLKTFERFGVLGTSVITAITAQDTRAVRSWMAVPPAMVAAQLDALAADLRPHAVKSGMLAGPDTVAAIAEGLARHALAPYVLDPVLAATSGDALAADGTAGAVRTRLLPLAALVTPNLDEAERLTGLTVRDAAAMARAARALVDAGAKAALVTGGHLGGAEVVDVLWDGRSLREFRAARLPGGAVHGTGCALSAAVAAQLAGGRALDDAVARAIAWVRAAIAGASSPGAGKRVLDFSAPPG